MWDRWPNLAKTTGPVMRDGWINQNGTVNEKKCNAVWSINQTSLNFQDINYWRFCPVTSHCAHWPMLTLGLHSWNVGFNENHVLSVHQGSWGTFYKISRCQVKTQHKKMMWNWHYKRWRQEDLVQHDKLREIINEGEFEVDEELMKQNLPLKNKVQWHLSTTALTATKFCR